MYEKELQRILNASQNNALTFFVGAGVSALSGAPTWKGLIHAISDKKGAVDKVTFILVWANKKDAHWRHPAYFIILFRFNAVADKRQ
mgnify:FL=1